MNKKTKVSLLRYSSFKSFNRYWRYDG